MDMEQYLKEFKNCIQKESPYCVSACPFHMNVLDFMEKLKRGSFKAAFKTYRNAVGFPQIAKALCHAPCREVCPRKDWDRAVELPLLEGTCIDLAGESLPTDYNLPMKKKRIAVIGAGIGGLSCALRLCTKKYAVELFERSDRIGGHLWELIPQTDFIAEIERQFVHEQYTVHLNHEIKTREELEGLGFDAVYVVTGKGGRDFGLLNAVSEMGDPYCAQFGGIGWFAGGELISQEPIYAMANGLFMGTTIDNYLKTGNLYHPRNDQETEVCLDPSKQSYEEPVLPADGQGYTEEEAQKEAFRCIECQCDSCRIYCDLTAYFNKWPLRIRDEILSTTLPGSSEVKATPAKRLLSTCNQCGLCKATCPKQIDLGALILEGRKSMHQQKKVPWVFHDFWLRDMEFTNGADAAICKLPRGKVACEYAYFPGCQLGASEPELVKGSFRALMEKRGDVGLFLQCCGAPAEWSGDEKKHGEVLKGIHAAWESLGKPTLILACPTCERKFKTYLSHIPVISLYEVMEEWGISAKSDARGRKNAGDDNRQNGDYGEDGQKGEKEDRIYSVFDPCAAGTEEDMKQSVRNLAKRAGYDLEPLPENEAHARCCGYGGQSAIANPDYGNFVMRRRIEEGKRPYIAYCINCRDIFRQGGKEALHILDVFFGSGAAKEPATVTERRENRINLKGELLAEHWGEEMERKKIEYAVKLKINEELKKKLNKERILEEDVLSIVDFCQRTKRKTYDPEQETYSGYREVGYMTCWVEYRGTEEEHTFELVNVYAHRMKIELEAVWNGRKTEIDL